MQTREQVGEGTFIRGILGALPALDNPVGVQAGRAGSLPSTFSRCND